MPAKGTSTKILRLCLICKAEIWRVPSHMPKNPCCKGACTKAFTSQRMSQMNRELNANRMTPETREKLRNSRLGTGEGKSYTKTYGRHTHRIVAEEKLGRPLKKGEIVHHIDEDKRNNDPDNIIVFSSQAEHARHHMNRRWEDKKK